MNSRTDIGLRAGIASTLAVSAYVHADLYVGGYRHIDVIGPSFLFQAAASFAVALLVALGAPWTMRWAAGALAAGSLVGFALSRTVGIFGFTEIGWNPAPKAAISVIAEVITVVLCAVSAFSDVRVWLNGRAKRSHRK